MTLKETFRVIKFLKIIFCYISGIFGLCLVLAFATISAQVRQDRYKAAHTWIHNYFEIDKYIDSWKKMNM